VRENGWRWPFYEPPMIDEPLKNAIALLAQTEGAMRMEANHE
jgi:hypothetical protein